MKASACGPRGRAVILGDQAVGRDGGDDEAVGPDGGDVGGNNEYENYDEPGWGDHGGICSNDNCDFDTNVEDF